MLNKKLLVAFILCSFVEISHAAVTVGTCQRDRHPYPTISAAIAAVPAGGAVYVCPGTYAEQLEIDKPLSIRGIMIANQPGVTILPPATGLTQLPANSNLYPQVFVNNAGGTVSLSNLTISGSGALISYHESVTAPNELCVTGQLEDFSGVYFLNTPGIVEHLNVNGQFASVLTGGDEPPFWVPNCGNAIEFINSDPDMQAIVRESVVSNVGHYGIYSSGNLTAVHNIVTGGLGPQGVGIKADRGTIKDNLVTSSLTSLRTEGIEGGTMVQGNTIQSAIYGIVGATTVQNNTLLNNSISLSSVTDASGNLISAPPTYFNPECGDSPCSTVPVPTVGVDLGCGERTMVQNNGIAGVGIGLANLHKHEDFLQSNLFSNVTTTSTNCIQ